ncbi:beta-fructofuranosidase [Mycoplasma testudineum]|uniref:beta-fructofuranosidase n=1 Tax=Mycoplasma testudineum TaxID=244584 RepID=A0A4R6IE60_9MOLU|nr:glycoside hydrolase family 32 protein [Mycoplasma testudineum]OYD27012.1 hypothetical protein CG473_01605 [Mycoplasma testudineum]TDO20560.1 beta-fructofuranosidase [Mycoplasma testudineum]
MQNKENILKKWNEEKLNSYQMSNKDNSMEILKLHKLSLEDPYYNQLHLSPYSGLLNDPNGLMFFDNKYHIFYQWSPFKPTHHVKKWGYYSTTDFINFENHHIGLEIENQFERNGIYSGGALVDNNQAYLYWTGNFKKINDYEDDDSAIYVGKWKNYKIEDKSLLFKVDKSKYTRHFRDPKVFKYQEKYIMLIGAQNLENVGKLVTYISDYPDKNFEFFCEVNINNFDFKSTYMIECPDIIFWDNNKTASLIFSTQGRKYFEGLYDLQPHVNIAINGKINIDLIKNKIIFNVDNFQILDHGFDFYASQLFSENEKNKLMIAWAGMPDTEQYATFNNMWAHNLTLPRKMIFNKGKINFQPVFSIEKELLSSNRGILENRNIFFDVLINNDFVLELKNKNNHNFKIYYDGKNLTINKSNMSHSHGDNFGDIRKVEVGKITNLKIILDNSLIEIYNNEKMIFFTSKYFINDLLTYEIINGNIIKKCEIKKLEINWND